MADSLSGDMMFITESLLSITDFFYPIIIMLNVIRTEP